MAESKIVVRYSSRETAESVLKRARGWGFRSAKDQIADELLKSLVLIIPTLMFLFGKITKDIFLAYVCGYVAIRFYQRFVSAQVFRMFGPEFPLLELNGPFEVHLSEQGVELVSDMHRQHFSWPAVGAVDHLHDVLVVRVLPSVSLPIAATALTDGAQFDAVVADIKKWREAA